MLAKASTAHLRHKRTINPSLLVLHSSHLAEDPRRLAIFPPSLLNLFQSLGSRHQLCLFHCAVACLPTGISATAPASSSPILQTGLAIQYPTRFHQSCSVVLVCLRQVFAMLDSSGLVVVVRMRTRIGCFLSMVLDLILLLARLAQCLWRELRL